MLKSVTIHWHQSMLTVINQVNGHIWCLHHHPPMEKLFSPPRGPC